VLKVKNLRICRRESCFWTTCNQSLRYIKPS